MIERLFKSLINVSSRIFIEWRHGEASEITCEAFLRHSTPVMSQ